MTSILVVDDDVQLRNALTRSLHAYGYESKSASGYDEALQCLNQRSYDVLITDLRMSGKDGIDLLVTLREAPSSPRPILMSAYATARESQRAMDLGAVRVLCKPFDVEEMLEAVRRAEEASGSFSGSVHALSLVDMLQMFHYGRRSLTLQLLGRSTSSVSFQDGQVIDARHEGLVGEPALKEILSLPAGTLRTTSLGLVTPTIGRPFQSLLLDILRGVDEGSSAAAAQMSRPATPASVPVERSALASLQAECDFDVLEPSDIEPAAAPEAPSRPPSKLDPVCCEVVRGLDGALACAVIDLSSGLLLGLHSESTFSMSMNELLAESVLDLFRGARTSEIERMVRRHRKVAENAEPYFEEILLSSKHNLHLARALARGRAAVVLVTRRSTNVGLCWSALRAAAARVEPLTP